GCADPGPVEFCFGQVRIGKVRAPVEIAAAEIGVFEIRLLETDGLEIRIDEAGSAEVAILEFAVLEVAAGQLGVAKVLLLEADTVNACRSEGDNVHLRSLKLR